LWHGGSGDDMAVHEYVIRISVVSVQWQFLWYVENIHGSVTESECLVWNNA